MAQFFAFSTLFHLSLTFFDRSFPLRISWQGQENCFKEPGPQPSPPLPPPPPVGLKRFKMPCHLFSPILHSARDRKRSLFSGRSHKLFEIPLILDSVENLNRMLTTKLIFTSVSLIDFSMISATESGSSKKTKH